MFEMLGWTGAAWGVGSLAILGIAAFALRDARRGAARIVALEARIDAMRNDLAALCATQSGAGDRLLDTEKEIKRAAERLGRLELRAPGQGDYRQAIALAARGASSDDLVADCGLERAEADLVALMYRHGQRLGEPHESALEGPGQDLDLSH